MQSEIQVLSYLYQCTYLFGRGGQVYVDTLLDYGVYIVQKYTGPILIVLVTF
jgi:hypothetical protein